MKKLELIDKFMIIALIFFSMMFCSSLNAQEKRVGFDSDNENIYGEWISMDGDHRLFLNYTDNGDTFYSCLLYTSPSPRDRQKSRMPSSA